MDDKYIKLSDAKNALADYIAEQTVSKYGSLEACREARFGAEGAMKELDYVPATDVAPKSEVAREIFEKIEEILSEYPDEHFAKFPYMTHDALHMRLSKLKKKYTEGKT